MKKSVIRVLLLLGISSTCRLVVIAGQDAGQTRETGAVSNPEYSELASELLKAYTPPGRKPGVLGSTTAGIVSPPLSEEHIDKKYRTAWEELLLASVSEPADVKVLRIHDRIVEALGHVVNNESIPALKDAFRSATMHKAENATRIDRRQKEILGTMSLVCNTNSFAAILSSLELADETNQITNKVTAVALTVREYVFRTMMQPDNTGKSELQKQCLKRAQEWKQLILEYEQTGLSQRNREFIEHAKAVQYPEEGK